MKIPRTTGYAELYWYCPTCKKEIPEAEIQLIPHGFQPFAEAGSYLPPMPVCPSCRDLLLQVGRPVPQEPLKGEQDWLVPNEYELLKQPPLSDDMEG